MLQVSISGQALVFVVRTERWSFLSRAGLLTYIAFFAAQVRTLPSAVFLSRTHSGVYSLQGVTLMPYNQSSIIYFLRAYVLLFTVMTACGIYML